jgi:hypothetical protein
LALVQPLEVRGPSTQVEGKRPTAENNLGVGEHVVPFLARRLALGLTAHISLDGPLGPRFSIFTFEDTTGIDQMQPCINRRYSGHLVVRHRLHHENFDRVHELKFLLELT